MIRYLLRTLPTFAAACWLLFLAPMPGEAQNIPSPYQYIDRTQSAGVFAGYLRPDKLTPDLGPQAAPLIGLRYNLRFGGPATGEVAVGFAPSERTVFRNAAAGDTTRVDYIESGTTPMRLLLAEAGIRFDLTGPRTWNGLTPFLLGTVGGIGNLSGRGSIEVEEDQQFEFGPRFALGVGAGTQWFLTNRLSLRAEIRDQLWRTSIPGGLRQDRQGETQWTNNLGLLIGTAIHF